MDKISLHGREILNSAAESEEDEGGRDVENSTTHESSAYEEKESIVIGNKETQQVSYTRILVMLVLLGVAAAVCVVVYMFSRQVEHDSFETNFVDKASKLASEFEDGARRRLSAVEALGAQITSFSLSSNQTWPNVVLPDFERMSDFTMEQSDVLSIIIFPMVTREDRASWEAFSVENQEWLVDGLLEQGIYTAEWDLESIAILEETWGESDEYLRIREEIFKVDGTGRAEENGPGPYAPVSFQRYRSVRKLILPVLIVRNLPIISLPATIVVAIRPSLPCSVSRELQWVLASHSWNSARICPGFWTVASNPSLGLFRY